MNYYQTSSLAPLKLEKIKYTANILSAEKVVDIINSLSAEIDKKDIEQLKEHIESNFVHLSGDDNIGELHISSELYADKLSKFKAGIYIGNAPETFYAPSANMTFGLGQKLSVFGTNSIAVGSKCVAGTNVLSVIDMYFSDNHDNGMAPNTIKLDSIDGLSSGMAYLIKITANYGTTGQILSVNASDRIISCDQIPSITYSSFHKADGQTPVTGVDKTTNLNVIWIKDHPEIGTIAYADGAHAEGIGTKATQDCCHAEGNKTVALGKYSHAEGNQTYAGYNGHSEGYQTSAMLVVRKKDDSDISKSYTPDSMDGGAQYIHAEGAYTKADQRNTHSDGIYSWARHRNSYIWNGDSAKYSNLNNMYQSHGEGTYNINPVNGLSGFYIGDKNLNSYIFDSLTDIRDINNLRDTFVVKNDCVTFYNLEYGNSITTYPTIVSALNANADYALNHTINFKLTENMEMLPDMYTVVGSVKTSSRLKISNMKVVFDLNGFCISSKCDYLMHISENAEVEVKNGKIRIDSDNGQNGFILCNGGVLKLSNVEMTMIDNGNKYINLICVYDHDDLENMLISFDGSIISATSVTDNGAKVISTGTLSANACRCEIDQYCKLTMNNCKNDNDIGIWGFGPSPLTKLTYGTKNYVNGRYLSAIQPEIIIDGQITMNASDELADTATLYGNYTHGADSIGVKLEIGPHARINVERGHALYSSNENTQIVVKGGYIHGTNGITVRGGTLTIPKYANPTIIGDGDYHEYDPGHSSGQAGSGLFMGHAILLETVSSGYGLVNASIESGNIIGQNNSSIGSYKHNGSVQPRAVQFVSGGTLNRGTSMTQTENGVNSPDYNIVKNGYVQNSPVTIVKQDSHYIGILDQYEQRIAQLEAKLEEAERKSNEIANT